MNVEDLYDYDELRQLDAPTVFVARVNSATLVLGGNQSSDVVDASRTGAMVVRRHERSLDRLVDSAERSTVE